MDEQNVNKTRPPALDEWHYRQDVLNTLFMLSAVITFLMAVAYLLLYVQTPLLTTLTLGLSFLLLPPIAWGCLRLLRRGKMQLALQIFIGSATLLASLVMLFMPANYMLIGMMGIFILVRISTFVETSKSIVVLGTLWAGLYLATIIIRDIFDIPQMEFSGWVVFFWDLIPVSILVIFVLLDRTVTRYLAEALTRSELARQSLSQSYVQLEQQKAALEKSEAELSSLATRLEQTNRGLQAANEELRSFAYVVSHDIRAPLRAIHNYADFLSEDLAGSLETEPKIYLKGLSQAVQEAEELVEDLLEFSRLGRQRVELEPVNLDQFFSTLLESLDLPSDVEITCPETWPALQSEPTLLRQIFQNLMLNAVKFNHSSPKRVELGWQSNNATDYEFFVRDNGLGISPRYHQQIFQVFQRLHTRREYEGTGIGLAIVKKAVDKLGGTVRLESTPGKGSTFFITLPKS